MRWWWWVPLSGTTALLLCIIQHEAFYLNRFGEREKNKFEGSLPYSVNLPNNKILDTLPPIISSTETQLLESERVHLSRLRWGHHPSQNTYKQRIDNTHTNLCPLCQVVPHKVTHLIEDCPNLADLRQQNNIQNALQLWSDPISVVPFLRGAGILAQHSMGNHNNSKWIHVIRR